MRHRVLVALGLALGLLAGTGDRANADSPPPFDDVDGLFSCVGQTTSVQDDLTVMFSSTGPHYADGTVLRLAVLDIRQPANARVAVRVDDDTVVLPDGWWSEANGWGSAGPTDDWRVTRSITGLSVGTKRGSLTWGLSIDGGPFEPYTVAMVAEVARCAEPTAQPSPPPTSTEVTSDQRDRSPFLPWLAGVIAGIAVFVRPARRRRGHKPGPC